MKWIDLNDENNKEVILFEMHMINNAITEPLKSAPKCSEETVVACVTDEIDGQKKTIDDSVLCVTDYDKHTPLTLIELQLKVINYLLKFFKVHRLNSLTDYEPYLRWIMSSSEHLAQSIKQHIARTKNPGLMRSSYKFCNKKSDCQTHYGFLFQKKTRCCMNDHYVHNKIVSDIDNLIEYLHKNDKNTINKVVVETELKKGLETINYVINHMYQELSSFMLYLSKSKYSIKDFYRYA
jgi:hypothetical protein